MIINKMPIKMNFSKRVNNPQYIVVHDTGNPRKGAGAMNHYKYFNSGYRAASAHYFVDDSNIIETVEVYMQAWHCGDGRGRYGIRNSNSIGIEMCINADGNRQKMLAQTRELIRFLMDAYNIPKSRVVRHYDASRKRCPGTMAANNWEEWKKFHASI